MSWKRNIVALFILSVCLTPMWAQEETSAPSAQDQKEQQSAREGELSSSKDTRIDLTPPADDAK